MGKSAQTFQSPENEENEHPDAGGLQAVDCKYFAIKFLRRKLEPVVGVEPTTYGLQNRCSTTELNWLKLTLHRSLTVALAWYPKAGFDFARTPQHLDRCNDIHFGRVRANGKLFRRSSKTDPRALRAAKGEVITRIFSKEIENHANYQPRAKLYQKEVMVAPKKTWPELYSNEIARFSQRDRNDLAALPGKDYSPTRFNGALGIVPRKFSLLARPKSVSKTQRHFSAPDSFPGYWLPGHSPPLKIIPCCRI